MNYTDALRNTGYKNVESAIAEIVDNSIEAKAKDIIIIFKLDNFEGWKRVTEIAVLDNGIGMDDNILSDCLVIGESTRRQRKGMGRFGVGLPQASLHVSPRVEVYSWQENLKNRMVYLDIEEIRKGAQATIQNPVEKEIPQGYEHYFDKYKILKDQKNFKKSGTLVIWKNCDRLNPKTVSPLYERFKFLLGRKFRHFINNEDTNIYLTVQNTDQFDRLLKPNDPLFLMRKNLILGDREHPKHPVKDGEPIFEHWVNGDYIGSIQHPTKYLDKDGKINESVIEITFSIAKQDFQKAGGENQIGKFCKKHVGISVVRANREIDFGKFDFFEDVNEPQHRWWGCEIKFEPPLDERFGVSNNKQQVELFSLDSEDYQAEEIKPIWFELNEIISPEIKTIYNELKSRKKGSRSKQGGNEYSEENIVEELESRNTVETASIFVRKTTEQEQINNLIKKQLQLGGNPDPNEDDINRASRVPVKLDFRDLGDNSTFIDINKKFGNCWLTINTGSIFYREIYSKIEDTNEDVYHAFNLVLMAFARTEDESFPNSELYESFKEVREMWGIKLRKYLNTDYLV